MRLRPVPEMGVCLAYCRSPPQLHRLNPASWRILRLCDGREPEAIVAALAGSGAAAEECHRLEAKVRAALAELWRLGIVEPVPCAPPS